MRKVILLLLILRSSCLLAFNGKVVTSHNEPVIGASVFIVKTDSTVALKAVTDTLGNYNIEIAHYPVHLLIRCMGYLPAQVTVAAKSSDNLVTVLKEDAVSLNEVVVTPEMMHRYDSHNSFIISQTDMSRYPTFAQSMNVIPFLNVSADGAITYRGSSDIVILLNGAKTTTAEIRALAKSDVLKIDVYENPPAQYALAGASAVVNIITKHHLNGGNVAMDLNDSFHPVKGTNNISAFFNTGQSRFMLQWNNEMGHYKRVFTDESLQYELNGTEYTKTKHGQKSPSTLDMNTLTLGFMTHKADSWQLNANLSTSFYKYDKTIRQTIAYSERDGLFNGSNYLNNHYNSQALNLYFTKMWKGSRQLLFDVTGTLYDTHYISSYNEWDNRGANTFSSESAYKSDRHSILSTIQYSLPGWLGNWTFGANETYQYGKQKQEASSLTQKNNTLYGYAQLYGHTGKLNYQLIAAAKYLNVRQDNNTVWAKWYPSPSLKLWYTPVKTLTLQAGYLFTANVPSVSLMSETAQWLDNHYVYRGNASLKPYKNHYAFLNASLVTKHLNTSFVGMFDYTPNAVMNYFERKDNYILQSYGNMKFTNDIGGQLIVDYFPLNDKSLKLHAVGIYLHYHGKEQNGRSWNGYRYQFMSSVSYAPGKWFFEAYYQYPGQTMQGQLVTPRAECVTLDVAYRPIKDMSIGLQWVQPFMKSFKEGEHTTHDAIIQSNINTNTKDWCNMVCLKFMYNISFGKTIKAPAQKIKNVDYDSGLLAK